MDMNITDTVTCAIVALVCTIGLSYQGLPGPAAAYGLAALWWAVRAFHTVSGSAVSGGPP